MYPDGKVCISILHPPGVDEMSGEDPAERWLPTRSIETIILSVIMLLSCPNFSSPANIDASVELRKEPEKFNKRVRALVEKSLREKPADVKIPHPDTDPAERAAQVGLFFSTSAHHAHQAKERTTSPKSWVPNNREDEEKERRPAVVAGRVVCV